jgi:hypothetical protein
MSHGGRGAYTLRLTLALGLGLAATRSGAQQTQTYHDPFAYCAAVGDADAPDSRYTGPALPLPIVRGLQKAFGVAATAPLTPFEHGSSWRCMDGAVYACNVGANLPCDAKPASDPAPSDAIRSYCADNRDASFIPMYVTGHDTLYEWSCAEGSPRRGKETAKLDARGYIASIWHRIEPPR